MTNKRPARLRNRNQGIVLITSLMLLSLLMAFTSSGLTRSIVQLSTTNRAVSATRALHLAEAGVDAALQQILNNAQFTDPAFNGNVNNAPDPAPLRSFSPFDPANAAQCVASATNPCFTVKPLGTVFNPFSTRGTGSNQRFGMAEELRFQVDSSIGTAEKGTLQIIRANIARAQKPFQGIAATQQIFIGENAVGGTTSSRVHPDDYTNIYGDLRTNWGSVRTWSNSGPLNYFDRPVQIPDGAIVHGHITIGPPIEDPVGFVATDWTAYHVVSPIGGTSDPTGISFDGVWVGPRVPHTLAPMIGGVPGTGINFCKAGDPRCSNPWTFAYDPQPWVEGSNPKRNIYEGDTFTMPQGVPGDDLPTALPATGPLIPTSITNDPRLSPSTPSTAAALAAMATTAGPAYVTDCSTAFDTANVIPGDGSARADTVVLPGGVYCYTHYWVESHHTVYYTGPTTIYVTGGDAAHPDAVGQQMQFVDWTDVGLAAKPFDWSNVGSAANIANMPHIPTYDPVTNSSPYMVNGGVSFRTLSNKRIDLHCLSHLYGSLVAPNVHGTTAAPNNWVDFHHNAGFDNPRDTVYGAMVVGQTQIKSGADIKFFDDGKPAGPWIQLISWHTCSPNKDDDGNHVVDDNGDICK